LTKTVYKSKILIVLIVVIVRGYFMNTYEEQKARVAKFNVIDDVFLSEDGRGY
jgi:hypothetical protein